MRAIVVAAFMLIAGGLVSGQAAAADTMANGNSTKPTIVLVHGAWAAAGSFNSVIAQLQKAGFTVLAPPNMLRGLASDSAVIANFLKSVQGPVILVGHSYGGAVISVASASAPNVKALVYIDAFVPDAGDSCLSLLADAPPGPKDLFIPVPFATATGGDADLYFNPKYFGTVFAADLPASQSAIMAVTQRPITNSALNEKAPAAEGWKTIPSWYVIGDADQVIPPKTQLFMALRAKAHITHAAGASHVSMTSQPEVTIAAIMAAVSATSK